MRVVSDSQVSTCDPNDFNKVRMLCGLMSLGDKELGKRHFKFYCDFDEHLKMYEFIRTEIGKGLNPPIENEQLVDIKDLKLNPIKFNNILIEGLGIVEIILNENYMEDFFKYSPKEQKNNLDLDDKKLLIQLLGNQVHQINTIFKSFDCPFYFTLEMKKDLGAEWQNVKRFMEMNKQIEKDTIFAELSSYLNEATPTEWDIFFQKIISIREKKFLQGEKPQYFIAKRAVI